MDDYVKANLKHWNEVTPVHERSAFYDVAGFRRGNSSLKSIELEELRDVSGKTLLHLQCHFGLDTLSWARKGATVTGIDMSDKAIDLARSLSAELGIPATFVESELYELPNNLTGEFDIVFTSYGVLIWLSNLEKWGEIIARFLKPSGTFYIVDGHPLLNVIWYSDADPQSRGTEPYFHTPEPVRDESEDYTGESAELTPPTYEWTHSLGDIVYSLIGAGLRIEFLHEFPVCAWRAFPSMKLDEDGWWRSPEGGDLPITFSIKATKPA